MYNTSSIADPGVDALEFRTTRSGRVFSEWAEISARTFDIAMAVAHSIQLNHGHDENLAELDSGPPTLALAAIQPATASTSAISMPPKTRRDRDKARSKLKRQAERTAAKAKTDILLDARPRHPRHLSKLVSPIKATFEMRKVRIASTGWIGLRDDGVAPEEDEDDAESGPSPTRTLPDFFGPSATLHGFTYVPYDSPEARPIVDAKQKVCGVFGGMPDDPNFMRDVHDPAVEAMEDARTRASIAEERTFHRRGNYAQLTGGNSHGSGQFEPGELVNGAINAAIFASLISNIAFIRLAGFATGLFANWAPNLFDFYVDYMRLFYKRYKHLKRPFLNGIFSACTFNLGPRTCALGHRDFGNLAFGWCAITAFGDFDYRKGGHLILWDCKLILEFPPGCTILIPSAAIFHSNIPIASHERRFSFTQYTAGGLFRWVEHDFQTEESYFEGLSREERLEEKELGLQRACEGAAMFSTLEELKAGI
ncbi:hypothetical protein B0H13DRAFT_1913578 [Mycena leptocephala]|nr:hypothetical protein B0H13DRAFT_1913578 [Mycena leptocephala]